MLGFKLQWAGPHTTLGWVFNYIGLGLISTWTGFLTTQVLDSYCTGLGFILLLGGLYTILGWASYYHVLGFKIPKAGFIPDRLFTMLENLSSLVPEGFLRCQLLQNLEIYETSFCDVIQLFVCLYLNV